mgnify:CR=1 FL=1
MTDHTPDYRTVGEHFLDFTITFFNLAKSKYQQQNQIKANSVGFQALILLNQTGRSAPTMSELAARLEITKQQLTKLVNDLEEKGLVKRSMIPGTGARFICTSRPPAPPLSAS